MKTRAINISLYNKIFQFKFCKTLIVNFLKIFQSFPSWRISIGTMIEIFKLIYSSYQIKFKNTNGCLEPKRFSRKIIILLLIFFTGFYVGLEAIKKMYYANWDCIDLYQTSLSCVLISINIQETTPSWWNQNSNIKINDLMKLM